MRRSHVPRQLVGLVDQGLASFSNLLVSVSLAHVSTKAEFGAFGVVFAFYLIAITLGRGAVGSVASLRIASLTDGDAQAVMSQGVSVSLILGLTLGVPLSVVGWAVGGTFGWFLTVLGFSLPILILQDSLRFFAFSRDRGLVAAMNDGSWLAAQVALLGVLMIADKADPVTFFGVWAITSGIGAVAGLVLMRLRPVWGGLRCWYDQFGSLIRSLVTEQLFITGVAQGAPLLVGIVSGISSVGQMRAVQTVFGPVTAFNTGLSMAVVPPAARRWANGDARFHIPLRRNGAFVALVALTWAIVIVFMPESAGEALLGPSWHGAESIAIVTGIWLACGFASAPAISALRIIGRQWSSARARVVFAPFMLLGAGIGAASGGAQGATAGLAATTAVSAITLWVLFQRASQRAVSREVDLNAVQGAGSPQSTRSDDRVPNPSHDRPSESERRK